MMNYERRGGKHTVVKCWMSTKIESAKKRNGQTNPPLRKINVPTENGRVLPQSGHGRRRGAAGSRPGWALGGRLRSQRAHGSGSAPAAYCDCCEPARRPALAIAIMRDNVFPLTCIGACHDRDDWLGVTHVEDFMR